MSDETINTTNDRKQKQAHLKPVSGDAPPETILPSHLEDLRSSALTDETIEAAKLYSAKGKEVAEILGYQWRNGPGLIFPFIDYDSRKTLLCRVKPDKPRSRNGKPAKYEQPAKTGVIPYFGPGTIKGDRLADKNKPLFWVEGEKKTLAVDQLGYAAIGLTGCHNFNDGEANRNGDGMQWAQPIKKYATRFFEGRAHVICFDADVWDKEAVKMAAGRLAGLLLETGATKVGIVRIPRGKDDPTGLGIDDYLAAHGEEKARAILEAPELVRKGEEIEPITPKDPLIKLGSIPALRGAKLDPDLRLPPGFEIRRDRSLWVIGGENQLPKEIMRSVAIPSRLLHSSDFGSQRVEVAFFARGAWQAEAVDRKSLRDARRALSDLPPEAAIDSNNAGLVVIWFSEYWRHNEHRLSHRRFVSKCGWHTVDEDSIFLLDTAIGGNESNPSIVPDSAGDRGAIISSLCTKGDPKLHLSALREAFETDPMAAMSILAALASPLLRPMHSPNFAVHLFGESSKGKTSIAKIAASVYGDPSSDHLLGTWNTTAAAMEMRAETLNDLLLPFDEIGASDARLSFDRTIYMLINGTGRSRSDRNLRARDTASWRSVVLSTGEHEIIDDNAQTGAQVRVLQFRIAGFGRDAAHVDALREACEENFGHVGRTWIRALLEIEDWAPVRAVFHEARARFRETADGALMGRQAVYWALLAVTEHWASQALGIGRKGGHTVREAFEASEARSVVSAAERARETLSEWIAAEPQAFPPLELSPSGALAPHRLAHVREIYGVRHGEWVHFLPEAFRERLRKRRISTREILQAFKDAGAVESEGKTMLAKVRWGGSRHRVYSVRAEYLGLDSSAQMDLGDASGDFQS